MATVSSIQKILEDSGFKPIDGRAIIVKYAAPNLSAMIASFFSTEYYVLQICEDEIVLLPFSEITLYPKKEVSLSIPISTIKSVDIKTSGFNYNVALKTDNSLITLSVQQKELSSLRSAGVLSGKFLNGNWHSENLDETLEALRNIKGSLV